jgi:hypothetical protein
VWRILTDERLAVSLTDLEERWSIVDLADAHSALDARDELRLKGESRKGA